MQTPSPLPYVNIQIEDLTIEVHVDVTTDVPVTTTIGPVRALHSLSYFGLGFLLAFACCMALYYAST